jgi:hypothetical protein
LSRGAFGLPRLFFVFTGRNQSKSRHFHRLLPGDAALLRKFSPRIATNWVKPLHFLAFGTYMCQQACGSSAGD